MQSSELKRVQSSISEKKAGQSDMTVSAYKDFETKITDMSESMGKMS